MADNKELSSPQSTELATVVGKRLDVGALVGVRRNGEFSAGGRVRKFSRNAWVDFRPVMPRDEIESA